METEEELNAKIMKLTMVINENYPELGKYLNEMPITVPIDNHPEVNRKNLEKYFDSLLALFRNYVAEHQLKNVSRIASDDHHL